MGPGSGKLQTPRQRRAQKLERTYAPAGKASFSTLTATDAQAILKDLAQLEFTQIYKRFNGCSNI